jgi:Carboxypeptidase regulatory-like domain
MKRFQWLQYAAAGIASLGFVVPSGLLAADAGRTPAPASAAETPSIMDVVLGEGRALSGQVLDAQGAPLAQTLVTVRGSGSGVASAVTDAQGYFSVRGLQGGVYEVTSGGSSAVFRVWTAGAGPPSARKSVLIVAAAPVGRGQYPAGPRPAGPRPPGPITNGQVVIAGLLILGATGAIVAISLGNQQQPSGS